MSVLAFAVQFSSGHHPKGANLIAPALALVVTAVVDSALLLTLQRIVPPTRHRLRSRRARKRRFRAAATAELRARAMMDELCPNGWQAEIVMFSSAEDVPDEAPDPDITRVQLDWEELHTISISRRVWGPDLSRALEAMVADRATDVALHQIEQNALAEGVDWEDY